MKKSRAPFMRGLTVQLLAITVLPLTLLLLLIAFGSVSLHQQDMRALVGERDERAVHAAAAALVSELYHRAASINNLVAFAEMSEDNSFIFATDDLASDFDGGVAYLDENGLVIASSKESGLWEWVAQNNTSLGSPTGLKPVFSTPVADPDSDRFFIIVSQYSASRK